MCGRFVGSFTLGALVDEISTAAGSRKLSLPGGDRSTILCDDFNVAPTRLVPVVRLDGDALVIEAMRWGLVPTWAKEVPTRQPLVNARSETVHEKPTFRHLLREHRCIVPMNGFYEWDRTDPRRKIPYFVPRADGHLLLCASLWSRPAILDGLASCAVMTRESRDDLSAIHDRCPVHVEAGAALDWLTGADEVNDLVDQDPPQLAPRRVSDDVNSVRNNGPHLLDPVSTSSEESPSPLGPLFG